MIPWHAMLLELVYRWTSLFIQTDELPHFHSLYSTNTEQQIHTDPEGINKTGKVSALISLNFIISNNLRRNACSV